jgi:hypothetical protein
MVLRELMLLEANGAILQSSQNHLPQPGSLRTRIVKTRTTGESEETTCSYPKQACDSDRSDRLPDSSAVGVDWLDASRDACQCPALVISNLQQTTMYVQALDKYSPVIRGLWQVPNEIDWIGHLLIEASDKA